MNEEQNLTRVPNPHDKLFREVWGDLENVRDFLQEYLPADQLVLMDPASLEICKDSFIEKVISIIRNAEKQGLSVEVIAQIAQIDVASVKKILNNEQIDIPLHLLGDNTK